MAAMGTEPASPHVVPKVAAQGRYDISVSVHEPTRLFRGREARTVGYAQQPGLVGRAFEPEESRHPAQFARRVRQRVLAAHRPANK